MSFLSIYLHEQLLMSFKTKNHVIEAWNQTCLGLYFSTEQVWLSVIYPVTTFMRSEELESTAMY